MKVSVLMSVYNENINFLKDSISSVLTQSFKDFEFIIVNDCSDDSEVLKYLNLISKEDKRVSIVTNKKNIGLTKSLNIGLNIANGAYIARIDSDDVMMETRLEKQLKYIVKKKCILVTSNVELINNNSKKIGAKTIKPIINLNRSLFNGNIFIHSTFFFDRKKILDIGGYNEGFLRAQDYDLLLNINGKYKNSILNLDNFLVQYRVNSDSISFKKGKQQECTAIKIRYNAIKDYGYSYMYIIFYFKALLLFLIPLSVKRNIITLIGKN